MCINYAKLFNNNRSKYLTILNILKTDSYFPAGKL